MLSRKTERKREREKARRLSIHRERAFILDKQLQILRTALFWAIMQPVAVILTDVSKKPIGSIFRVKNIRISDPLRWDR